MTATTIAKLNAPLANPAPSGIPTVVPVDLAKFGAVGDGITDDSAAINAAVAYIRTQIKTYAGKQVSVSLEFTPGAFYRINSGLNFTGLRLLGLVINGNGATIYGNTTGKPVIDALFSRFIHWKDLTIVGDQTNVPTYGMQYGVKDNSNASDANKFDNMTIVGFFSVAAAKNRGSETCTHIHCKYWNDSVVANSYSYILDGDNNFNSTSDFVTVTSSVNVVQSFNENSFIGCDFRKSFGGKAIAISGEPNRHKFIACYGVSVDDYIVATYRSANVRQLDLDIHCETTGCKGILLIDNVNPVGNVFFQGLKIRDHNPQCNTALIDTTGTTRQVLVDACELEFANVTTAVPIWGATAASTSNVLVSGVIRWEDSDTLTLSNITFTGMIFTEPTNTISHTLGTYQVVRRPSSATSRAITYKGELRVAGTRDGTTEANYVSIQGAVAAGVPEIKVDGTDTDIDLRLTPKNAGAVRFGTLTANADAPVTGYITIKDAAGNTRKLAIIA